MELIMQTVCAHCYTLLTARQQRTMCILCTKCEQNWAAGKTTIRTRKLPSWEHAHPLPAQRDMHLP